jgi:hypothetical protein
MYDSISSAAPVGARRRRPRRVPTGYVGVGTLADGAPVSRSTIYNAIRDRKLAACLFHGRLVVEESTAKRWLAIEPLPLDRAAPVGDNADE